MSSIFTKVNQQLLIYKRRTASGCIGCGYNMYSRRKNHDRNSQKSQVPHLLFVCTGIVGFSLYLQRRNKESERDTNPVNQLVANKLIQSLSNKFSLDKLMIVPSVDAAVPIDPAAGDISLRGRREKFNFIADVVDQVAHAVVYIEIKDTRRLDFFTGKPMTASNGSGFVVKEDGLILTNAHVVINKPHSRVDVRLQNGKEYTGVVETVDTVSDLATVRIPVKGLKPLPLGKSSSLRPGEFVVAIGSPLTLSNTVTAGVVSAAHRGSEELGLHNREMFYIQTDAAITFGNSGGPLVNLDGEAIGINSMKVTAGISFAIPSDYAKEFLARTPATKPPDYTKGRKYMGITMLTLSPDIIHELRQKNQPVPDHVRHGVLVWKVILGSPAHFGGLLPGDIVTHINGNAVRAAADVYAALADETQATSTMTMTVVRTDGQKVNISVTPE